MKESKFKGQVRIVRPQTTPVGSGKLVFPLPSGIEEGMAVVLERQYRGPDGHSIMFAGTRQEGGKPFVDLWSRHVKPRQKSAAQIQAPQDPAIVAYWKKRQSQLAKS